MIIARGRFRLYSKVFVFWEACRSASFSPRHLQARENNPVTFHRPAGAQRLRRPARKKERSALWFHDVQHGRCPKAFAQQYVSVSDNRHAGHEAFNVSVAQNHLLDVAVRGWCPARRFDERNREDHGRFGGDIPLFDFD
ncbi:MAG: hypothetical protein ACLSAA_05435 [Bifidobacterium bifidum]